MVQNDENQNDVLEQASQKIQEKTGETAKPKSREAEVKAAISKKLISAAGLKELVKQIQEFNKDVIHNPHTKTIMELQAANLTLAALAAAQVIPGVEEIEDLPKALSTVLNAVNKGKQAGVFKKLYNGVPPELMAIPVLPEIYKSTINKFKTYKEGFLLAKDLTNDASARFKKFIQPSAEVQAARLQFASPIRA